ncbi:MAG: ribosome-associated translation inhibitor RaiA [bacterium]
MIQTVFTARKFEADSELKRYVERKLSKLDRLFPRQHTPTGLNVEIHRDEGNDDPAKRYHARAKLSVAGPDIVAETASMNPHTAVDILEAKLKDQIRKHKEKHLPKRLSLKDFVSMQPAEDE